MIKTNPVIGMTRLLFTSTPAGLSPSRQRAGRLISALLALTALVAQAAVTHGSNGDITPSRLGSSTGILDKALSADLTTGDRNLDLLLESQRKGGDRLDEAPAAQAMPARPTGGRQLLQPLPEKTAAAQTPRPPEAGLRFAPMLALPERSQLNNAGLHAPKAARDWSGGSGQTLGGPANAGVLIDNDASHFRSTARPLRDWILEGVAFLKGHLFAILLGSAAIALLVMGLKAYSRRI